MKLAGDARRYGRVEIILSRREQRADMVRISAPSGGTETVEPFDYVPIEFSYDEEGFEYIRASGKAERRCRFTPREEGLYTLQALAEVEEIGQTEFLAERSSDRGYVGVSQKDPRYFAFSDGSGFVPVGINLAFPTGYGVSAGKEFGLKKETGFVGLRQYERWMRQCSRNGVNLVRIWLGHEYFCPDTEQCGELRWERFTLIDRLLDMARSLNLKVKLTLEQFRYFNYTRHSDTTSYEDDLFRKFNKKLYAGSRRCENMTEFLDEDMWRKGWLMKVKEFSRRYSGDTTIFAIELWNEINAVQADYYQSVLPWCRTITPQVRSLFPFHMVVNSLGSLDSESSVKKYRDFPLDGYDFQQIHRYLDQGADMESCRHDVIEMVKDGVGLVKRETQPLFVAETGAVNNCHSGPFRFYANDHRGILFVDAVYTPLFVGAAGCGNLWHWDDRYVESKNLYSLFQPLVGLIQGVSFTDEEFIPEDLSDHRVRLLILRGKTQTLGFLRNRGDNWATTLRENGTVSPVAYWETDLAVPYPGHVEVFPIWKTDTTRLVLKGQRLCCTDIRFGTLLRITRSSQERGEERCC